ncbi:MAG: shikimate kinase [Bacteroidota bacterium]
MKIVLVGYMGSGKSTVGQSLARELNLQFLDLDTYIEKAMGTTIPDLFETKGEIFFRKKEYEYLNEILRENKNFVLSTGGGTPCYSGNMDTILAHTPYSVYLKVSIMELVKRLSVGKEHRPLIKDIATDDLPEFFGKHLFERSPYYNKAKHILNCDGKEPLAIVAEIKELLL